MRCKIFLFLAGLLFIALLIGLVNASCDSSQRIMRLYQTTNSHGAIWDYDGYSVDVCFDEIFGFQYAAGAGENPHECDSDGKNKIINLYQTANSHAEISGLANYNNQICFGNLECRDTDARLSGGCSADEWVVLSLYQTTNSHVAKGDFAGYPIKICCKGTNIERILWTNMNENPISEANKGDRVKLMALGSEFSGEVSFQIYKDVPWWFDKKVASGSLKEFTTWVANEAGEYYFTVTVNGVTKSSKDTPANNPYGTLTVSENEENSPPVARIVNPKQGEIYTIGTSIDFNQSSYDVDDFFDFSWNFGDENIIRGSSTDYVNYNTTHSYSSDGKKDVNLEVKDGRGLIDEDRVSILTINLDVNKNYVFANILKPEWNETIPIDYEFSALGSYAIQVLNGNVICLGGECPLSFQDGTDTIPISDDYGLRGSYSMFDFTWLIDDSLIYFKQGNPLQTISFIAFRNHFANLTVVLNSGDKNNAFVKFNVAPLGPPAERCNNGFWYDDITKTFYDTTQHNGYCTEKDSDPNTNCCPPAPPGGFAYVCGGDSGSEYCHEGDAPCPNPADCSNYTTRETCLDDSNNGCNVGALNCVKTISDFCNQQSTVISGNCKCQWNDSIGKCYHSKQFSGSIFNGQVNLYNSKCSQQVQPGECQDGTMLAKYTGAMFWNETTIQELINYNTIKKIFQTGQTAEDWLSKNCQSSCLNGVKSLLCGEESIKLGFFSWINLLFAMISIAVIYLVFWKKKRH